MFETHLLRFRDLRILGTFRIGYFETLQGNLFETYPLRFNLFYLLIMPTTLPFNKLTFSSITE